MRAHYTRPVTDDQGNLLPNAQIGVYDPGTTNPITAVLYGSDSGSDVLANPFTSSTGIADFYLDVPARVRIGITQGGLPTSYYEDVDVLAAGVDGQHTGGGANSLVIGSSATAAGDHSTALGQSASAGGVGSTALGQNTSASADNASALGNAAVASATGGTAVGQNSQATGASSTALGHGAQASGVSSAALGDGAHAAFDRSTAVGNGATTFEADQVLLGNGTAKVEVAHGSPLVLSDSSGVRWVVSVGTDGTLSVTAV